MRRILYYSLLCLLWVSVNSCKDDEASQPPTPTFTVDRTSGLSNSTEFAFTIDQVSSNAVSLLPYGVENPNDPGILIPASSFTNGKAVVKVVYSRTGTFNAVVVANNHNGAGESIKNSISAAQAINVSSDKAGISDFSFDGSTKTVIDTVAHTIVVTVPAGTDVTKLKANYSVAASTTTTVNGTAQSSGGNENNFSSPVTYVVKSNDGSKTVSWVVTVLVTAREKTNSFKSFEGLDARKGSIGGRVLPADIDSAGSKVVLYDTLNSLPAAFDSVSLDFALKGGFARAIQGTYSANGVKMGGKDTVSLATDGFKMTIVPQDSALSLPDGPKTYDIYFRVAPRLHVMLGMDSTSVLFPGVSATASEFTVNLDVLNGTQVNGITSTFTFDLPASTTVNTLGMTINGAPFINGGYVNYTKPVTLKVPVTEGGITFWAAYTVSVTVVK